MKYKLAEDYEVDVEPALISKRILQAIEKSELTYQQLEEKTNIPKSAIQRYASGQTKKIPDGRIFAIARATHTSIMYLLGQTDTMEEEPYSGPHNGPLQILSSDGFVGTPEEVIRHNREKKEADRFATDVVLKVMKLNKEDLQKVDDYIDLLLMRQNKEENI